MPTIPQDLLVASSRLGAKPTATLLRVFLPLSGSGAIAGAVPVFLICRGFSITPEPFGGGRTILVSRLVQRDVEIVHQWGSASAVAVVVLVPGMFSTVDRIVPVERILGVR